MPGGLRGFVTVEAIAAALSSTNSVLGFALALLAMAVVSYFWQRHLEVSLISFALGVMAFAYTGLLGIYFAVLFTKRGTQTLLPFALFGGFVTVALLEFFTSIGFDWQIVCGSVIAFLIMMLGENNG